MSSIPDFTAANQQQEGAVEFRDWHQFPFSERAVRGLTGKVSVHSAVEVTGFDVNDKDSNWLVLVEGPSGFRCYMPGCQIAGIFYSTGAPIESKNPEMISVP